ncbi:hypothetical protein BOX15_Mlig023255g3 [Macrostomum lignano]|uniref:Uncharacterized protein n=2 Tax=Macrostomum lignano TaxID=282301 RepID=A0A267FN42_9PLAT|nr:hypothetical protein BOX15_Mlig023255g3 [Macrostomum lignano]
MMRHFMEKPQLLGAACDSALLTRCWHRLSGVLSHGAPDCQSVAWRLRQGTEGAEFAAELVTLCGQLIREAELRTEAAAGEQQQPKERQIQQQDLQSASASWQLQDQSGQQQQQRPQSPHSCDRRTSASQLTGILSTVCSSADCVIRHLKRLVEATTATAGGADVDRGGHSSAVENINAIGNRLGESISRLTSVLDSAGASLRVKPAYLARLDQLKSGCLTSSLSSLSFEFFYSVFTDTLLLRRSLGRRLLQADSADAVSSCTGGKAATAAAADQLMLETAATNEVQTAPATNTEEVASLLSLISSVSCDLYLAIADVSSQGDGRVVGRIDNSVLGVAFQCELRHLTALAERHGFSRLGAAKRRRLQQAILRLTAHMKAGGGGGGGHLQPKSVKTLIRLLLEIRLHLDRQNLESSEQLWLVEKTLSFAALPRYLALRGSRVLEFTCWSQDSPQLRRMLNPYSKDPGVLRVERQCRCRVSLLLPSSYSTDEKSETASIGNRTGSRSLRSCQLVVDLRACHGGSHSACIRLLSGALKLTLEPCQATVQVPIKLA